MRTKKQTRISYAVIGFLILVLGVIAVPNFLPARFVTHELLTIRVRVIDQKTGQPVAGALVRLLSRQEDLANPPPGWEAYTDSSGVCALKKAFEATGTRRAGQIHISDQIQLMVQARGFKSWASPLAKVFGPSRDYYDRSRELTHTVSLEGESRLQVDQSSRR